MEAKVVLKTKPDSEEENVRVREDEKKSVTVV